MKINQLNKITLIGLLGVCAAIGVYAAEEAEIPQAPETISEYPFTFQLIEQQGTNAYYEVVACDPYCYWGELEIYQDPRSGVEGLNCITVKVGSRAFAGSSIHTLYVCESITEIADYGFADWETLEVLMFAGDAPTAGTDIFQNSSEDLVIYYERGTQGWTDPWNGRHAMIRPFEFPKWKEVPPLYYALDSYSEDHEYFLSMYDESYTDPISITVDAELDAGNSEWIIHVKKVGNYPCSGWTNLTEVIVSEGIEKIGVGAFMDCISLTNVVLPSGTNNYLYVEAKAFKGCTNLQTIFCASKPWIVYYDTFTDCPTNMVIYYREGQEGWTNSTWEGFEVRSYPAAPQTISMPPMELSLAAQDGLKAYYKVTACDPEFAGELTIPYQFEPEEVQPPESGELQLSYYIREIAEEAFKDHQGVNSVKIEEGVKEIGERAFAGCSNLTTIVIPEGVAAVENEAFSHCTSLQSISLPDSVVRAGGKMLEECSSLTSVKLSASLPVLREEMFVGNTGLVSVEIPAQITELRSKIFENCSELESIIFAGNAPVAESETFLNCPENVIIYYNAGAQGWSNPWNGFETRVLEEKTCVLSGVIKDGYFVLSFEGERGKTYQIQQSSDGITWNEEDSLTAETDGTVTWTAPEAVGNQSCFYRLAIE